MPTYSYRVDEDEQGCSVCDDGFETEQSIHDDPLESCPECDSGIHRIITRVNVNTRPTAKTLMKDKNLKRHGFKKLMKGDDGKYRDVLDRGSGADKDGKLPEFPQSWD